MTEKEKMLAGHLYDPSDPELDRLRMKARKLARRYNLTDEDQQEAQQEILRELLPRCLPGVYWSQCYDRTECHPCYTNASTASGRT